MIYYEFWKENYVKNDKNPREMSFFSEFFFYFLTKIELQI